jgi:hypothetical protein
MRIQMKWTVAVALTLTVLTVMGVLGVVSANASTVSASGVEAVLVEQAQGKVSGPGTIKTGNAAFECAQLGFPYGAKVDSPTTGAGLGTGDGMSIDYAFAGGTTLAWSSNLGVSAVLLKAGTAYNVYLYEPDESTGDAGLITPAAKNGNLRGISHVTFCWDRELAIAKTAAGEFDRTHAWSVTKTADAGQITEGEVANFTIAVSYDGYADANHAVAGVITVTNPWTVAATGIVVTDEGATFTSTCPTALAGGASAECAYEVEGNIAENTAGVSAQGFEPASVTVPVEWTANHINGAVNLLDIFDGSEATTEGAFAHDGVNAGTVQISFGGLAAGTYTNVARLVNGDGESVAEDDAIVMVVANPVIDTDGDGDDEQPVGKINLTANGGSTAIGSRIIWCDGSHFNFELNWNDGYSFGIAPVPPATAWTAVVVCSDAPAYDNGNTPAWHDTLDAVFTSKNGAITVTVHLEDHGEGTNAEPDVAMITVTGSNGHDGTYTQVTQVNALP